MGSMSLIQQYRERMTYPEWRVALVGLAALPFGYTLLSGNWGLSIITFLIFLAGVLQLLINRPIYAKLEVLEFKASDYPWFSVIGPIFSILLGRPIAELLNGFEAVPENLALFIGAAFIALGMYSAARSSFHRDRRIGIRRGKRVLEQKDLRQKITDEQRRAVAQHKEIIAALIACGAIDGVRARAVDIARVVDVPLDDVTRPARELESQGVITVGGTSEKQRMLSLPPIGVWAARAEFNSKKVAQ